MQLKNSKIVEFGDEMLKNVGNIALQNVPILYNFVSPAEICDTFNTTKSSTNFGGVIQQYPDLAHFARLYFPHFSTFRGQTLHFTNFKMLFLDVVIYFIFYVKIKI